MEFGLYAINLLIGRYLVGQPDANEGLGMESYILAVLVHRTPWPRL